MVNYREILRLRSLGYSQRQIAASVHSSRDTVGTVSKLADEHGIAWPIDATMTDIALQTLFYPNRINHSGSKEPDYGYTHKELAKPGVTLPLLWSEYCESCYAENLIPYMYTQYCDKYRDWAKLTKATMRIRHKPGDIMQVDWAGNTMAIYDPITGESVNAYLFVAVLPCSCYAYAEACSDMKSESWILCHVHAYSYFGGVTRILIPDNLKTGVIKNAHFAAPSATIEGIEYHADRKLDKAQIIRLSTCQYIDQHHHIILEGASGNGKTYLACALGNAACRKFKSVRYIRMPELLEELSVSKGCGTFKKTIRSFQKVNLLILDEWLIRCLTPQEAYDLLEIIESRCSHGSTIFYTQYSTKGWYERISPDNYGSYYS